MTRRPDPCALQILAWALELSALVVLALTPASAYGWVADILPAPGLAPEDPVRDVRLLLTGAVLAVAAGLNLWLAARRGLRWALANLATALVLAGFWTLKFLV